MSGLFSRHWWMASLGSSCVSFSPSLVLAYSNALVTTAWFDLPSPADRSSSMQACIASSSSMTRYFDSDIIVSMFLR